LRRVAANRRNILFISQNRSWGGSETWWQKLALEARGRGFRATVVAHFYPENRRYLNHLAAHGVSVHQMLPDSDACLEGVIRHERVTVVHANLGYPLGLLAECELACRSGIPLVVVEHLVSDDFHLSAVDPRSDRKRRVYDCASRVVYVSERNRRVMRPWLSEPHKSCVIKNGVDLSLFKPGRFRDGTSARAVCVGRLETWHKGQDLLLHVVAELLARGCRLTLDLVGDGPSRSEILELSDRLGISARLRLLGQLDNVQEILAESDIFILLSRREGTPIAVAEALACGLPCVVTDVGGNAELVTDGVNGFVVPPENIEAAVERLQELVEKAALRRAMGLEAAAFARQQLDWRVVVDRMFSIYDDLTTGNP
jgi:glycosyltransferase involved in cell wall biosynthesis